MNAKPSASPTVDLVIGPVDVLVTPPASTPQREVAIVVHDGLIDSIVPWHAAPVGARHVDGRGRIAMPGMINAHAHAAFTLTRGWEPELPLDQWLSWVFRAGDRIGPEHAFAGARLGFAEMLLSGITTCVDHHYATADRANTEAVARAAAELGIRVALATTAPDLGAGAAELDAATGDLEMIEAVGSMTGARIEPWVGLASPGRRESPNRARALASLARSAGTRLTYHYAETHAWLDLARTLGHDRPVDLLADLDLLGPDVLLAHGVWFTDGELDVLADTDTALAHNPVSNMYLGDGAAPVREMLDRGMRVALGTDGANCNNRLDLFASMKVGALLQKLRRLDGRAMTAADAFRAATQGGAAAIGHPELGQVAAGAPADLVLVDARSPAFQPGHDPLSDLVYVAQAGDVRTVLIDGEVLVEDHRLLRSDVDEICVAGRAAGRRIVMT